MAGSVHRRIALTLALAPLLSASPAFAQTPDRYDCADFTYQEEAQAIYDQDPSDPYGLDGPIGEAYDGIQGVACEDLPSRGDAQGDPVANQYGRDDVVEQAAEDEIEDVEIIEHEVTGREELVIPETIPNKPLPDTGGASLLGLAAIGLASLVVGASVLGAATQRRR